MRTKIVIAEDEPITRMDMNEILSEAGFDIVGLASNGLEAIELCRKHRPDLVLMDIKMPLLDGLKATKLIIDEEISEAVVLLTAYSGSEIVNEAKKSGAMGYIVKPIDEKSLLPEIEVAVHKGKEIAKLKKEMVKLKEEFEKKKIIEKAKLHLMKNKNMTEEDSYAYIRTLSMDRRCPMKEVAQEILQS